MRRAGPAASAGDAPGWITAAERAVAPRGPAPESTRGVPSAYSDWRDHQDYGENVTGDLVGNAIAGGAPAPEILARFGTPRGLAREDRGDELDSSAAWAVTVFLRPGLRETTRETLLALAAASTP